MPGPIAWPLSCRPDMCVPLALSAVAHYTYRVAVFEDKAMQRRVWSLFDFAPAETCLARTDTSQPRQRTSKDEDDTSTTALNVSATRLVCSCPSPHLIACYVPAFRRAGFSSCPISRHYPLAFDGHDPPFATAEGHLAFSSRQCLQQRRR